MAWVKVFFNILTLSLDIVTSLLYRYPQAVI